ncbi:unnamed protein product, partial [Symbiodinium microadriaticum]
VKKYLSSEILNVCIKRVLSELRAPTRGSAAGGYPLDYELEAEVGEGEAALEVTVEDEGAPKRHWSESPYWISISRSMAEDAARRAYVAQHVSADLVYVWEEMGVSLLHQRELGERYRSVALFSSIADTRADARAALRNEVTVGDNADGRAAIAALVAAWQSCYDMADQEKDEPSSTYLALKLEEVEAGELRAAVLDEVTSVSDEVNAQFQSSVDSSGRLRLVKERNRAKLPSTSEELRQRLRLECHTFLMLAARFRTKFVDLRVQDFTKHVDYVLGDKVYLLQMSRTDGSSGTQAVNPSWTLLLNFEHRLRKEAYKRACRDNRDIATTLGEVRADAALGPSASAPPPPAKWARLEDHVPGADKGNKGRDNKG